MDWKRLGWLLAALVAMQAQPSTAHAPGSLLPVVPAHEVPDALRVMGPLAPPDEGTKDLKFADVFRLPVGPRGLEPSPVFLSLERERVRLVGYMVALMPPTADAFMFSPLPAAMAVHDEGLADDIPASTLYVHLPRFSPGAAGVADLAIPQAQGLLQITGVLSARPYVDETTGRVFPGSIVLDPVPRRAVLELAQQAAARTAPAMDAPSPRILPGAEAGLSARR